MPRLTRSEIQVLRSVHRGNQTLPDLSLDLENSIPRISSVTTSLERKGFLEKSRRGASVAINFSSRQFMENLKRLFSKNLQFDKILGGSALPLLMTLIIPQMAARGKQGGERGMTIEEILLFSGLSKDTIYRTLNHLIRAGAINRIKKRYHFSESMRELQEFIEQFVYYFASTVLNEITHESKAMGNRGLTNLQATSRFIAGSEIIFSISQRHKLRSNRSVVPTALTAFIQDGLIFHGQVDYYHYSMGRRRLKKEDFALDYLLVNNNSVRNVSYTMLYLLKNREAIDWDYLTATGSLFGVKDMTESMKDYLDKFARQKVEPVWPFPKIKEFKELCDLYGVKY